MAWLTSSTIDQKNLRTKGSDKSLISSQPKNAAWYSHLQSQLVYANNIVMYCFTGYF